VVVVVVNKQTNRKKKEREKKGAGRKREKQKFMSFVSLDLVQLLLSSFYPIPYLWGETNDWCFVESILTPALQHTLQD